MDSETTTAPSPPTAAPDEDLRDLVRDNPGQATFEEYQHVRDSIRALAPCRLLIFGVGLDSAIWLTANQGGRTEFIEHEPEWIEATRARLPGIVVHQVRYRTRRYMWRWILRWRRFLALPDLPSQVSTGHWDIVFVDSPQGHLYNAPGRMQSIFTASEIARHSKSVHVLVHDCHRKVERAYSDFYLGAEHLVAQIGSLRHYLL